MAAEKPARRPAAPARSVEGTVTRMAGGDHAPLIDPPVPLSVRIPGSLRKRIRAASIDADRATQDIVAEALQLWLDRRADRIRRGEDSDD